MKITKQQLKQIIKEEMESLGMPNPVATNEPEVDHGVVSMEKIDRLREMKTEVDEMIETLGSEVDDIAEMALQELSRELETTVASLEIR